MTQRGAWRLVRRVWLHLLGVQTLKPFRATGPVVAGDVDEDVESPGPHDSILDGAATGLSVAEVARHEDTGASHPADRALGVGLLTREVADGDVGHRDHRARQPWRLLLLRGDLPSAGVHPPRRARPRRHTPTTPVRPPPEVANLVTGRSRGGCPTEDREAA